MKGRANGIRSAVIRARRYYFCAVVASKHNNRPEIEMPAYVVVQITVDDPIAYDQYKTMAPPSIAKYGGRYLLRGGSVKTLEGDWDPGRFVILEFPDAESAQAWWDSPEYAEAKALRQSAARSEMILADGPAFDPRTASAAG